MGTTGGILKFTDMDHPVGIAMFHQLHCLVQIRTFMQHAQEGKDIGWDMASNHRLADENMHGHWAHCFDYLRQVSDSVHFIWIGQISSDMRSRKE